MRYLEWFLKSMGFSLLIQSPFWWLLCHYHLGNEACGAALGAILGMAATTWSCTTVFPMPE